MFRETRLRRILSGGNRSPSRRMLRQIAAATHALSAERTDRHATSARLREFAQAEARKIGLAELARRLGATLPTCEKQSMVRESLGSKLQQALRRFVRAAVADRWCANGALRREYANPSFQSLDEKTDDER